MKPTLLLPILLILLQTAFATSESDRLLDGCSDGCIVCSRNTGSCTRCDDDYYLIAGVCYEPYVYKDMIYVKTDHFLLVDIDRDGTDVAVIVIFAILAFVAYMGSLFLMQKQDWKELVPEAVKEPVKTIDGKEHAKVPTPKGEHVVEMGEIEARQTPTPKSATPGSPAKNSQLGSHRSKTVQEEDEEANLESSKVRGNEVDEDEDEEPYYPTKKEMATRNQKDHIHEEEEEEDADQVDIQVHDGENNDEDEARTAQETPSPKTDLHSSPTSSKKKTANKRKGSNHSDADYEDDNRPQVQSNAKNNQHRGNEGEDEEEEFESARSGNGNAHGEEEEEEEEEEEQEDVMDLNDLGLDNVERKQ